MPTRRDVLATGAGLAIATTSAGCLDLVFGGGLSVEATAPSVAESALEQTGYREKQVTEHSIERTFEAGGQSRDVTVTNWQAEYDKAVDTGGLGGSVDGAAPRPVVFSVLSSPRVEVLGREFNPIDDMGPAEIVAQAQSQYGGVSGLEEVGEQSATLLGTETTVTEFRGDLELQGTGTTVEVALHVTGAVSSGGDFVLAVGGYPTMVSGEREHVFTLLGSVQHDG